VSRPQLLVAQGDRAALAAAVQRAWSEQRTLAIAAPEEAALLEQALPQQSDPGWGAAVVLGTGGSSGARRWCLQPLTHLQVAADATGSWLRQLGLDPQRLELFNPLPLQHVSGLLPLVRAQRWGAALRWLEPEWMRDPVRLPRPAAPALLSLVPTQLQRLMAAPAGLAWLRQLAVIWVGGAPLPAATAAWARAEGLRLAPCYGATETAAMVCALAPQRFLAGAAGCGPPLADVELRLEPGTGAIAVRTARLSPGWLEQGVLRALPGGAAAGEGWWCSGDGGQLTPAGLVVLGRLDGAIHSGGETVFPEVLEQRLLAAAQAAALPLAAVLLLAEEDPEWGQRLVGLVRPLEGAAGAGGRLLEELALLTRAWLPAERPRRWLLCAELAPASHGKWQRGHWRRWLASLEAGGFSPRSGAVGPAVFYSR